MGRTGSSAESGAPGPEPGRIVSGTLAELVPAGAARHPERELFCFQGRRVSYREFDAWTAHLAAELVRHGVRRGDRVLVQLPNRLEALALQVAAFRAGALDVPVVPIYRTHEMRAILADCRPAAVCAPARLGDREPAAELDTLLAELGQHPAVRYCVDGERDGWEQVPGSSGAVADLPTRREESPDSPWRIPRLGGDGARDGRALPGDGLPQPLGADEPALLLYTSGTTSAPKGALLTGRAVLTHLAGFAAALGADAGTVTLAATPLSHLGGFVAAVVLPAFLGARSVIMPAWRPDEAVELIEREQVTLMMGATVFVSDLVERYESADRDGGRRGAHRLDTYAAAGATLAPELVDRAAAVGMSVVRAYGMTETAGVCAISSPADPLERRRAWDGRPLPGMEIRAVDDDGAPVGPGEIGHLRIRGPQLLSGYTDPASTAAQLDAEGWFAPGDLGQVDAEGWVRIAGRTKDIVNRGGEKFSTLDIEQAVAAHPGVRAVAVTAVPDDRLGEAVGAWVVVEPDVDAASLLTHLHRRDLARAKFPVEWHVVAALPVTASGKVQKHRLPALPDLHTWKTPGRSSFRAG